MTEQPDGSALVSEAATPEIKQHRSFSIVWIVPIVALLIGAWLVYKAVSEKGPTITITFESADGLEAGKTKIKYKDVVLGTVTAIALADDFSHVTVTAEMAKESKNYLTEKTRFWVVRARVAAGQVTGLGTLFSGAYIGIDPDLEGKSMRHFKGLEKPPMVTGEVAGRQYRLAANRLGSLTPGSPIYFRQIQVGQVVDFKLEPNGENVAIDIFVQEPYYQFVRQKTRFWIASGLDVDLTANGLRVDTESVVSLLIGGLAFATFPHEDAGPEAEEGTHFQLYDTYEAARDDRYTVKRDMIVEIKDSVRGLSVGAPVEFRGLQIGMVTGINLDADFENLDFTVPVRIELEPERLHLAIPKGEKEAIDRWQRLLDKGFRAQLETGNLLTGQLYIKLDIFEDAPPAKLSFYGNMPVIPALPSSSQEIMQGVTRFVKKLDQLPLEAIGKDLQNTMAGMDRLVNGPDLRDAVKSLRDILDELKTTTQTLNADTVPRINTALAEMTTVIKDLDGWVSADAPLQGDLRKTLEELAAAGRAISDLADMLERHPEALIQGKGSKDQ
ncbi:MAG: MCE family protein [Desulfobacteraceae bacterium]|nr:MCE family protein [Desulfobacteraceae bacterium]MBC2750165.1 MCE family protein [Desulfobacteraceae bacterium]